MIKREFKVNSRNFIIWLAVLILMFLLVYILYPFMFTEETVKELEGNRVDQVLIGSCTNSSYEDMVKSLNRQTSMIRATCSDKDEEAMLGSMIELVNVMLNKAIGEAVDSTMTNLGKFFGIDDLVICSKEDEIEELKNMEKCDGEA